MRAKRARGGPGRAGRHSAKLAALKTERPNSFRKKGHEEQYVFNAAVNSKIAETGL